MKSLWAPTAHTLSSTPVTTAACNCVRFTRFMFLRSTKSLTNYRAGHYNLPITLEKWLFSNGAIVRDCGSLNISLGPGGAFFAFDKAGATWGALPRDLENYLARIRQPGGAFNPGCFPQTVSFGPNGQYVYIAQDGDAAWHLMLEARELSLILKDRKCKKTFAVIMSPCEHGRWMAFDAAGVTLADNRTRAMPEWQSFAADFKQSIHALTRSPVGSIASVKQATTRKPVGAAAHAHAPAASPVHVQAHRQVYASNPTYPLVEAPADNAVYAPVQGPTDSAIHSHVHAPQPPNSSRQLPTNISANALGELPASTPAHAYAHMQAPSTSPVYAHGHTQPPSDNAWQVSHSSPAHSPVQQPDHTATHTTAPQLGYTTTHTTVPQPGYAPTNTSVPQPGYASTQTTGPQPDYTSTHANVPQPDYVPTHSTVQPAVHSPAQVPINIPAYTPLQTPTSPPPPAYTPVQAPAQTFAPPVKMPVVTAVSMPQQQVVSKKKQWGDKFMSGLAVVNDTLVVANNFMNLTNGGGGVTGQTTFINTAVPIDTVNVTDTTVNMTDTSVTVTDTTVTTDNMNMATFWAPLAAAATLSAIQ